MAQPRELSETEERVLHVGVRAMSKLNTWIYRASRGRLGGRFLGGAPVLLLTTRGRKTGEPRTAPLIYAEDEGRLLVVASKGGSKRHPLWYRNLVKTPDVEVEVGGERRLLRARTATPEEKAALWPRLLAVYRDYASYQARTRRDIPVVILEPR